MTTEKPATDAPSKRLGGPFWRLWTSAGLSNFADGILKVALPLVAIEYTRSPTLIAGLAFAFTLPWLLFALPAGALADRVDRRKAMLAANGARAALVAVLVAAMAFQFGSIWALYLVAFCVGTAETVYDTASQSILPQIVSRDQLSRANARLYVAETVTNQFIGPPLGGLLVAVGAMLAIATPAALWVVAIGALLFVRGNFSVARKHKTTFRADIAEGLRFLWHQRILRTLAILTGLSNLANNAAFAIFVLFAVGPASAMHLSAPAYGILLTTIAIGSLAGSVIAPWVERTLGRKLSTLLAIVVDAAMVGVLAFTANVYVIGALFFLGGVSIMIWNVIAVSLRQRITPDHLLGRVNSGYRLVAWGTMPVGAALGGALAQWLGLEAVFAIMGALTLSGVVLAATLSNAEMHRAEADAAAGAAADAGAVAST